MLVHPTTSAVLEKIYSSNVHAVLLSGPEGCGKFYLAKNIAFNKLGLGDLSDLENYPHIYTVEPEKQSISIDQIRSLQKFLQLKTPGIRPVRRVVTVRDAHLMTNEAQNALLKSLEEPPDDTIFILTAQKSLRLKETVHSRVQQVSVLPVTEDAAIAHYSNMDSGDVKKAYLMSDGHVGLLHALLHDEGHPLIDRIAEVKQLMAQTVFERLTQVDVLSKQKDDIPLLLQACKLICRSALRQSAGKFPKKAVKWHQRLQLSYECEAALEKNPSTKLLLTRLFMEL